MKKLLIATLKLPLIGTVIVSFSDKEFADFCLRQINSYKTEVKYETVVDGHPLVSFRLNTSIFSTLKSMGPGVRKFSRAATVTGSTFSISENGRFTKRKLNIYHDELNAKIDIWHTENKFFKHLKCFIGGRYKYNHAKYYNSFLYVLFSIYYAEYGFIPVHAALIIKDDQAALIYGLDGVGKSTLSTKLMDKGCKVPSDNITLLNGDIAVNLVQTMRLSSSDDVAKDMITIFESERLKEVTSLKSEREVIAVDYKLLISMTEPMNDEYLTCSDDVFLISSGAPEVSSAYKFISNFTWLKKPVKNTDDSITKHLLNVENEVESTVNKVLALLNMNKLQK